MNGQVHQLIIVDVHVILFRYELSDLHRTAESLAVLLLNHINKHRIILIQQFLFHQSADKVFHMNNKPSIIQ